MKLIPLTQGHFAMVDDEDFERVNKFKWHLRISHGVSKHAMRWESQAGHGGKCRRQTVWMHHFISGKGKNEIDHKDGDGLNNQKSNFRPSTALLNTQNRSKQIRNTSGFKGVIKQSTGWVGQITVSGKTQYLGFSKDPKIVAALYDIAAIEKFGEFARTNKMLGLI